MSKDAAIIDRVGLRYITKGFFLLFSGRVAKNVFDCLFVLARAKILGPFGLGIFEICVTIARSLASLAGMGFQTSIIRFVSIYKEANDQAKLKGVLLFSLTAVFISSFVLSIALFFTAETAALNIFRHEELVKPLQFISLAIFFISAFNIFLSIFRATKNIKYAALIDFFQPFCGLVIFFVFLFFVKERIWPAVWAWALSFVIVCLIASFLLIKKLPFLIKKSIIASVKKRTVIGYTLPLTFISIITALYQRVDLIMIGYFLTPYEVGLYRPAFQLSLLVVFPLAIFNAVFAPTIAEYYHANKIKELNYLFKVIVRWICSMSLPVLILIILLNRELLSLFGAQYRGSGKTLMILAIGQFINALAGSVGLTLAMTGRQKILLGVTIAVNLIHFLLNILFIPVLNITGAAISTAFALILFNTTCLFFVVRKVKINPFALNLYKPFLSCALAVLLAISVNFFLPLENIAERLFTGSLFFLLYFFFLFLLKSEQEEKYIIDIIKIKYRKA